MKKQNAVRQRYFVPDLSPMDRPDLQKMKPRYVFIAESPHISEVESDRLDVRRPLCGAAGKKWWSALSELLEGQSNADVTLERLVSFCKKNKIVMMNAVQFPLDPKVVKKFPAADPLKNLGFSKMSGQHSYKKMKASPVVKEAIMDLAQRLSQQNLKDLPIHVLGNDAEWFVKQALKSIDQEERLGTKVPHPSAWWRKGGFFGKVARSRLDQIFFTDEA